MDDAGELRKLAEWYRALAEVGCVDQRENRLTWAQYLERKAEELTRRETGEHPDRAARPSGTYPH